MSDSFRVEFLKRDEGSGFRTFRLVDSTPSGPATESGAKPNDATSETQKPDDRIFETVWRDFVHDFQVFFQSFPFLKVLSEMHAHSIIDIKLPKFVREHGELVFEDKKSIVYDLEYGNSNELFALAMEYSSASASTRLMANSFIMLLSSQFDVLVSRLIHAMIQAQPGLLKSSKKEIHIGKIFAVDDLEELKAAVSEEFSESVIRKSRHEQILWLENILNITLTKDLPAYPDFIEINERRNLLAHTDGVISSQYIDACRDIGFKMDSDLEKGKRIQISYEYYKRSANIFFEIGTKLIHVIWRKLCPNEISVSDSALCDLIVDLNQKNRIDLAIEISKFCCDVLKKHSEERFRLMMLINYASALNISGDHVEKERILKRDDWSARGLNFRIAASALRGETDEVCTMMLEIGKNENFLPQNYEGWPIFFMIREEKKFTETFEKIFGRKFSAKTAKTKVDLDMMDKVARIRLDPIEEEALDLVTTE